MATLLLNMDAPIQSWGTSLKLKHHRTDSFPSKSGVIGMIASALGRRRDEDVNDLSSLRFGVRIDQPGSVFADWQVNVVGGREALYREAPNGHRYIDATSNSVKNKLKSGYRYYLSDARFTCVLEGDEEKLKTIREALLHPANALYLGRRNCPVTADLVGEISEKTLDEVLEDYDKEKGLRRIVIESDAVNGIAVRDVPLSFSPKDRRYGYRFTTERQRLREYNVYK